RQYVACLCSLPCCVKRRTQDARRFGIKGFIRKQGIHWLQFRRDHDLRLHPVAVATHVSKQISPFDRGMRLDSKKSHRGTTITAFRATTPFGGSDRGILGHVAVLGLDGAPASRPSRTSRNSGFLAGIARWVGVASAMFGITT